MSGTSIPEYVAGQQLRTTAAPQLAPGENVPFISTNIVWTPEAKFYHLDGVIGCGASGTVFSASYCPNIDKIPASYTIGTRCITSAGNITNTNNGSPMEICMQPQSAGGIMTSNQNYSGSAIHTSEVSYPCAIKAINLDRTTLKLDVLRTETKLMAQCNHPNLVPIYCSFVYGSYLWLVMPKLSISACDVMHTLRENGFEENVIASLLYDVVCGIEYLHNNKHIHRDIKGGNILLNTDGTAMLADFGVSAMFNDENALDIATNGAENTKDAMLIRDGNQRQTFVGSPMWLSPEIIAKKPYNEKTDIWALGITAIELAQGEPPNARLPMMQVLMATLKGDPPQLSPTKPFSNPFRDFVARCLQKDPSRRPTASELLNHPFLVRSNRKFHVLTVLKDFDDLCIRSASKNMNDYINLCLRSLVKKEMQNQIQGSTTKGGQQSQQQKSIVVIEGGAVELLEDETYSESQAMTALRTKVSSMTTEQCINSPDTAVRLNYYRNLYFDKLPPSGQTEQELYENPLVMELKKLDTEFCVCDKISGGKYLRILQQDELARVKAGNKILQTIDRPAVLTAILRKAWDFTEDDSQIESNSTDDSFNSETTAQKQQQMSQQQIIHSTVNIPHMGPAADAKQQLEHENERSEMVIVMGTNGEPITTGAGRQFITQFNQQTGGQPTTQDGSSNSDTVCHSTFRPGGIAQNANTSATVVNNANTIISAVSSAAVASAAKTVISLETPINVSSSAATTKTVENNAMTVQQNPIPQYTAIERTAEEEQQQSAPEKKDIGNINKNGSAVDLKTELILPIAGSNVDANSKRNSSPKGDVVIQTANVSLSNSDDGQSRAEVASVANQIAGVNNNNILLPQVNNVADGQNHHPVMEQQQQESERGTIQENPESLSSTPNENNEAQERTSTEIARSATITQKSSAETVKEEETNVCSADSEQKATTVTPESFFANWKNMSQSSQNAFSSIINIFQELETLRAENASLKQQNDKLKKRIRLFAQMDNK